MSCNNNNDECALHHAMITMMSVVYMLQDRMEVVTVLGAGLLVGTSLTVIIPEGVNTLFSLQLNQKNHASRYSVYFIIFSIGNGTELCSL